MPGPHPNSLDPSPPWTQDRLSNAIEGLLIDDAESPDTVIAIPTGVKSTQSPGKNILALNQSSPEETPKKQSATSENYDSARKSSKGSTGLKSKQRETSGTPSKEGFRASHRPSLGQSSVSAESSTLVSNSVLAGPSNRTASATQILNVASPPANESSPYSHYFMGCRCTVSFTMHPSGHKTPQGLPLWVKSKCLPCTKYAINKDWGQSYQVALKALQQAIENHDSGLGGRRAYKAAKGHMDAVKEAIRKAQEHAEMKIMLAMWDEEQKKGYV
ncbi:MAG: hypothetical protein M1814_005174 [Vezdaea aestivalis]|nr:MAG: hypothetical protein M1814_005174 [Vezdaea aestivalis]